MKMTEKDKDREFKNVYDDYKEGIQIYIPEQKRLIDGIEGPLQENVFILLKTLEKHLKTDSDWMDTSVYTGTSGIALLYLHFLDCNPTPPDPKTDFLADALAYVEPILPYLKRKRYSFLCGVSGPLAIAAVLFQRKGMDKEAMDLARRIENLEKDVCSFSSEASDELLYGRAGYLHVLLFLHHNLRGRNEHRENTIREVINVILESGQRNAKKSKNSNKVPLFYEWHNKPYIGMAHGFAGILYMLMQAKEFMSEEILDQLVRPTVDFVVGLQFPSGNFPSSLGNNKDRLVHWCHGAPGVIHLLLKAYEVFGEEKYLESARACCECIWQRGLLKKGYGICHGVSGNGYAQLRMFQATRETKYLYRAVKFAEWCFDYGKHGCRTPDRSLSLFEGFAGIIYFLLDLLNPEAASFPAFQL